MILAWIFSGLSRSKTLTGKGWLQLHKPISEIHTSFLVFAPSSVVNRFQLSPCFASIAIFPDVFCNSAIIVKVIPAFVAFISYPNSIVPVAPPSLPGARLAIKRGTILYGDSSLLSVKLSLRCFMKACTVRWSRPRWMWRSTPTCWWAWCR